MELNTALFANGSDESVVVEIRRWLQNDPANAEADFVTEAISARLVNAHADVAFFAAGAAVAITWAGICFAIGFTEGTEPLRVTMQIFGGLSALLGSWALILTLRASTRADVWVQVAAEVAAVRLAAKQRPWWKWWG